MKKLLVFAIMMVAAPAMADSLDDQWQVCMGHRLPVSQGGRVTFRYDSGFEVCGDVETEWRARNVSAAQSKKTDDIAKLHSLRGN